VPEPIGAAIDLAPGSGASPIAPWRSMRTTGRMTTDADPSCAWTSVRREDSRRSMGNLMTWPMMSLLMAQHPDAQSKAPADQVSCVLVHIRHSFVVPARHKVQRVVRVERSPSRQRVRRRVRKAKRAHRPLVRARAHGAQSLSLCAPTAASHHARRRQQDGGPQTGIERRDRAVSQSGKELRNRDTNAAR